MPLMQPHPRLRKTIMYGGAALTVLLVVVWIGSGWRSVGYIHLNKRGGWVMTLSAGQLWFMQNQKATTAEPHAGWNMYDTKEPFAWAHFFWRREWAWWDFGVPIWLPAATCLLVTALAFRLDTLARRRALLNLCPNCHYDRTGLAAGAVCPECGKPPPSA